MDNNRKALPDCKYSANPFHECGSDCLEKIAQGRGKKQGSKVLSLPGSFGKKQPKSPLNTRPYQNGAANSPKVYHSRPSPLTLNKQRLPEANKFLPSDEISVNLNGVSKFPTSPGPYTTAQHIKSVSPRPPEHDQKNDSASEINFYNDDYDDEKGVELDLESVMSDSCVSVGKYRVKLSVSTILQSIIDKHGDIAAQCMLESASMRSRYLECLCSLMQELGTTPVAQLSQPKVKEMLAVLKDLESVNIEVAWLRSVLEEFAIYQENTDSEKERHEGLIKSKKQELDIQESDLARIEKEVTEARLRVEDMKVELAELETEQSRLEQMGFKVEKFKGKSFLDELL